MFFLGKRRKLGLFLFILLALLIFLNFSVFAQLEELQKTVQGTQLEKRADIYSVLGNVIKGVLGAAGVILVLFFVYGGILWTTSEGNQEKIKTAKGYLIHSVIGLIIILASYALATFVIQALTK